MSDARFSLGQRLVRGAGWALLARAMLLVSSLVLSILLARLLPPAEVGSYFLAMSLIMVSALLAQAGMARPMVKLVASARGTGRPAAARKAVGVGLAVTLCGGSIIGLAIAGWPGMQITRLLREGGLLASVLPLLGFLALAYALIEFIAESLRGFQDLRGASLLAQWAGQRFLVTAVLAAVWLLGLPIELPAVLAIAACTAILTLLVGARWLWRRVAALGPEGETFRAREVLAHGPPFLLVQVNAWLVAGADLWVLGMFRPAEEVAIYGVASRIAVLVGAPLMIVNAALAPSIAQLYSRGEHARLEAVVRAGASLSGLAALAILLVLLIAGEPLLRLVYADAYAAGFAALVVLACGQLANVASGPCSILLTMTGHQRDVVMAGTIAAILTVLLLSLVAPVFGGLGVATVIAMSVALYNGSLTLIVWRRHRIRIWPTLSMGVWRRLSLELGRALSHGR